MMEPRLSEVPASGLSEVEAKLMEAHLSELDKLYSETMKCTTSDRRHLRVIYNWALSKVYTVNISIYKDWLLTHKDNINLALSFLDEVIDELPYIIHQGSMPYSTTEMSCSFCNHVLPKLIRDTGMTFSCGDNKQCWWDNVDTVRKHAMLSVEEATRHLDNI